MNRFALTLILAAAPLFAAGMLAQSENVSGAGSPNYSSSSASSANAKQLFRGYWTDGSNFTQDASCLAEEFSAAPNFQGATDQVNLTGRHIASALSPSRSNFQASEKKPRLADSKVTAAEAQLAQFNALYQSLTHGSRSYSGELSLAVYHQLMDQQFLAKKHNNLATRPRTAFNLIANPEKKPNAFSAANLEVVRMTAHHTEYDADVQAVTAARLKKAMQQRGYPLRPATLQRMHLSGEAAPARALRNPVVAAAAMHYADAQPNISGGFSDLRNVQRMKYAEVSVSVGTDNSSGDTIGFQNVPGDCGHGK